MRLDANSARSNNFDVIRFILAVLVIFSHSFPICWGNNDHEPGVLLFRITFGHLAVAGFFSISGYLILASWNRRKSILDYLRKRFLRIYPGWIVVNLITILIALVLSMTSAREIFVWILQWPILSRFEIAGAFPDNPYPGAVNGSLWTIPYEWYCYWMLLVLGVSGLLKGGLRVVVVTAIVMLLHLSELWLEWSPSGRISAMLGLAPFFLVGSCFYEFREKIEFHKWWFLAGLLACFVCGWVPIIKPIVLPIAATYVIFYAAFQRRVRVHSFGKYGDFSYGIYLYAFGIQQILVWMAGGSMHPLVLFALATPLSIIAGIASWYGVERWFLPQRRRREIPHTESSQPSVKTV